MPPCFALPNALDPPQDGYHVRQSADAEQVILTVRKSNFGTRLKVDAALDCADGTMRIHDEEPGYE
jgi:hypothetical protein